MTNIILKESVECNIKNILSEAYGISLEIEHLSEELCKEVKNSLKKVDGYTDENGNILKNGVISFLFKEKKFLLEYEVVNFLTEKQFDKTFSKYTFIGNFNRDNSTLFLTIAMFNGGFTIDSFGNTVQHELSHLLDSLYYEDDKIYDKERKIYNISRMILRSNAPDNVKDFAECMYISFKTEQIASANGLDNMLKNGLPLNKLSDTSEYSLLSTLRKVLTNFDQYRHLSNTLFDKTDKWCYKRFLKAYSDYSRRIARVIMKKQNSITETCFHNKPLKIITK